MPGPRTALQPAQVAPPFPNANGRAIIGGAPVNPLVRLQYFSPAEFEIFTYEFAYYALKSQYHEVQILAGAGDQGRDVIAWKSDNLTTPRLWDNYQCKHYDSPLAPSDFWLEIGKLCYYTFIGEFTVPDNYFIVSPRGVGPKLKKLLSKPDDLRKDLLANWDDKCKSAITDTKVIELEADLLQHINNLDFRIFKELPPLNIIDQHRTHCPTHALVFGGELKARPTPLMPPSQIAATEIRYVQQLYDVYSEGIGSTVQSHTDLTGNKRLLQHFNHSRKCFYCAESLKEFARDNMPHQDHFADLTNQIHDGITPTLYDVHDTSFTRLTKVCETALSLQITSNILTYDLKPADRTGICHQLANEDRVNWVNPDG